MSGLMGIVFGCSIVYIISRMIASQRRITALEQHITRKADDEVVTLLATRVGALREETTKMLTSLASEMKHALHESDGKVNEKGEDVSDEKGEDVSDEKGEDVSDEKGEDVSDEKGEVVGDDE